LRGAPTRHCFLQMDIGLRPSSHTCSGLCAPPLGMTGRTHHCARVGRVDPCAGLHRRKNTCEMLRRVQLPRRLESPQRDRVIERGSTRTNPAGGRTLSNQATAAPPPEVAHHASCATPWPLPAERGGQSRRPTGPFAALRLQDSGPPNEQAECQILHPRPVGSKRSGKVTAREGGRAEVSPPQKRHTPNVTWCMARTLRTASRTCARWTPWTRCSGARCSAVTV